MTTNTSRSKWVAFLRGKNKAQTTVFLGAIAVGLFFGGRVLLSENQDLSAPSVAVKRGDITIKITEIGELRARDQVTVSAINDKQIIWMVPEGQWVEKGDTLYILESGKYVITVGEEESNVQVAEAQLAKAMGELDAHKAKEEAARKNYQSLPALAEKGFVMESEVEQARLAYIELVGTGRSYEASVDAAKANVRRAQRALAQQERKLNESVVVAPRAGLVVYANVGSEGDARKAQVGMIPFEGMDLMYLPDISTMLVDAEISEVELAKIIVGQPAEVRLDAYPDAVFRGEVKTIADLARRKISRVTGKPTGAKVFDVTIKVLDADRRLKPGLTATVDIILNTHSDALYAPLEAIFMDELDKTVVYVKQRRKIESRPITIGESNDRVAVVTDGLEEGEVILLAPPSSI